VEKRDIEGGFKMSPLILNQGLGLLESWNEDTIKTRAEKLAQLASKVWSGIDLSEEIINQYKPKKNASGYSIEDHPNLHSGPVRELFELFRKEVIALDPCVTEEFLKLYIAYKAETNFVDVVPQAKALRLTLNMRFPDIYDPRGICVDVAHRGRWGNGDVEVKLSSPNDIPYIMSLIRQSFGKQMGNGNET
jgi:predicted transport protein